MYSLSFRIKEQKKIKFEKRKQKKCIRIRNSYRVNHWLGKALVKGTGFSHLKIIAQNKSKWDRMDNRENHQRSSDV